MDSVRDGGPAFPMPSGDEPRVNATTHYNEGMSLRDWFAGQALVGMYAADEMARQAINPGGRRSTAADFAISAYEQADAMLERRKS